jgi:hypothetical protein
MDEAQPRGKILGGTEGLGTVSPQMIEERARETAHSDGRAAKRSRPDPCMRGTDRSYIRLGQARDEKGARPRLGNAARVVGRESSDGAS